MCVCVCEQDVTRYNSLLTCRERKDTCVLTAVSLSIRRKKQTVLWVSTGLPADAFALVAVPDKAAALLLCPNYILYCQQVRVCFCYSAWIQPSKVGFVMLLPCPLSPTLTFTFTHLHAPTLTFTPTNTNTHRAASWCCQ